VSCVAAVLAVMLALPGFAPDRHDSPDARRALYLPTAAVICAASEDPWTQAILIATADDETHWARCVLEDRCPECPCGMRCDEGLATGPFQVRGHCLDAWKPGATRIERERAAARCTIRIYNASLHRCRVPWGGFTGHRGGTPPCDVAWARRRYSVARWAVRKLRQLTERGSE
jgi:hypothetical protein